MLSPSTLKKAAEEAALRLERERRLDEERRQREEEEKRLEVDRQRELEKERSRLRLGVQRATRKLIREAIVAASRGERWTQTSVQTELLGELVADLQHLGFACEITSMPPRETELKTRVNRLVGLLGSGVGSLSLRLSLIEAVGAIQFDSAVLLRLLEDAAQDPYLVLPDDAETYIRVSLKPLLEGGWLDDDEQDDGDQDEADDQDDLLRVRWTVADAGENLLTDLHQVPSWLLSTAGSGLMQRFAECSASDAQRGELQSTFELVRVPTNPERWGPNAMTKYVHRDQPIGVTPFTPKVMGAALEALGFKVSQSQGCIPTLTFSWG